MVRCKCNGHDWEIDMKQAKNTLSVDAKYHPGSYYMIRTVGKICAICSMYPWEVKHNPYYITQETYNE